MSKCRWWDLKTLFKNRCQKKLNESLRRFLLEDMQSLRYMQYSNDFRYLRFMDDDGILKSTPFRIKRVKNHYRLIQYPNAIPRRVSRPKGPMTFRPVKCVNIQYKWLGFRRVLTWEIYYNSTL